MAQALDETRSFSIQQQSLATAVGAFGRQSGLQVSLQAASANGVSVNAVTGSFTPEDALSQMLSGTGAYWEMTADGTVVISVVGPESSVGDGEIGTLLDPLTISGGNSGYQGTPDWVYESAESVSVIGREAMQGASARDTRRLFDTVAGAYAGDGQGSFPTVSPNIRGLQDGGRVIVSVDGARQNAQDGGRYGASSTGSFGAAIVDGAFIREVVVDKSSDASSNMAGSLGGAVEFRTVKADDLIAEGERWGVEVNASTGTNAYTFDGSVLAAVRLGEVLSLTVGGSQKALGEYEPGTVGDVDAVGGNPVRYDLTNRRNWSGLVKLEGDFGDVQASLSWMHQDNRYAYDVTANSSVGTSHSKFTTKVDTVVGDVSWDPDSSLISANAKMWLNVSNTLEFRTPADKSESTRIVKELTSFGASLENTSEWSTAVGDLSLNYGVEAFRDHGDKSAYSSIIEANPTYASTYGAFNPAGQRDIASAFLSGDLEPASWVKFSGGLRYDWYRLKGSSTFYNTGTEEVVRSANAVISQFQHCIDYQGFSVADAEGAFSFLCDKTLMGEVDSNDDFIIAGAVIRASDPFTNAYDVDIDRTDGAWLPSATISFKPFDWIQPYASLSHSLRPPTLTEAFISGAVSPSNNVGTGLAPNLELDPERARTYEIGANIAHSGLFTEDDQFRMKVSAFYREIDDYIVMGTIVTDQEATKTYSSFVNLDGTAQMRGLEIEGNYDAGYFWFGGAASWLDVNWPQRTDVYSNGTTTTDGKIFAWNGNVPPSFKVVLDGGLRFFDQKLVLGGRVTHVAPTTKPTLDSSGNAGVYSEKYTTLDLYGSYRLNDNATFRVSANNVTDIQYVPATGVYLAPGRTVSASMQLRF